jgi:predicted ATPase
LLYNRWWSWRKSWRKSWDWGSHLRSGPPINLLAKLPNLFSGFDQLSSQTSIFGSELV